MRAGVQHLSRWEKGICLSLLGSDCSMRQLSVCVSERCAIRRHTCLVSHHISRVPSCICPAVCYPHAVCQSACLSLCLSVTEAKQHVPIAVSTLCIYLPTCLSIWRTRSYAAFLSLCIPSQVFCLPSAYATTIRFCESYMVTDILGSKLCSCCRERPLPRPHLPTSQLMTVAFKKCTLSACTRIKRTYILTASSEYKTNKNLLNNNSVFYAQALYMANHSNGCLKVLYIVRQRAHNNTEKTN